MIDAAEIISVYNTVFFVPTYKIEGKVKQIDDISPGDVQKYRDNYNQNLEIELPINFTGGYNVGHICPPPKTPTGDCSNSGAVL